MMKQHKRFWGDFAYAAVILVTAFALNLFLLQWFGIFSVTPMVFVLGVFLIAWRTQGYFWGVASSLVSVMAVNYAFTYPYWAFNLIRPECLASAVVMLIVSIMTSTLTTQLKRQEQMKAEAEKERMRGNLLRAVSHDLRTPLTSIYGACSAMRDNFDALPRQTHMKLLSDVCADAQWLVRMVENLLSVTRVDAATVRLSKNGTVLEELIDAKYLRTLEIAAPTYLPGTERFTLRKFPPGHRDFLNITPLLRRADAMVEGVIGSACVKVVDIPKLFELALPLLRQDPLFFICKNEHCNSCHWSRLLYSGEPIDLTRYAQNHCDDETCEICVI